jgi:molybdate transport system ATP-binding protein
MLQLGGLLRRFPATLSGGEKQRVALGRALLSAPEVLLMDEPVSSLDVESRWRVLGYVKEVHRRFGTPILYVTHAIEEAEFIADSVGLLEGGRLVALGPLAEVRSSGKLFSAPQSRPFVNLLQAVVEEGRRESGVTAVRVNDKLLRVPFVERPAGAQVLLSISSADIILSREHPVPMSARNIYCGTVQGLFDTPGGVMVLLRSGFDLYVQVTREACRELGVEQGAELHYIFKAGSIRVLGE